ncbi:UDP-glycosyltransferase 708C1-like [Silene latifolia]|uniref:UDP-glycosyltransferase 708C1-like n=1 Tax=Silene latifolia TaxID=37657 RepID=UPI003D76AAD3
MDALPTYSHVAVCPSAGIGHLTPFLRLAAMISSSNCSVTLIIIRPTLSEAETTQINSFLSSHPHIASSEFHVLPTDPSETGITDPFFLQYDAVSRSAHLLVDHLVALSPQPSAIFSDLMFASGINKALSERGIDNYNVITTSAKFFSLMVSRLSVSFTPGEEVMIPGLSGIPADEIPPLMYNATHIMGRLTATNCRHLPDAKGVILNTFDFFEPETISALQSGKVFSDLPPIFPIGPLHSLRSDKGSNRVSWLDEQPLKSVVFVSFGSRTAMSKEQIKEIGEGLAQSGIRFLWVIKTAVVDKEDKEELVELLGEAFFEETKDRGLTVKEWVNQEEILSHPAIGGFVTHCGWNSVMEAAQRGLPLLAWPLHGDQRINAGVVKAVGLGIWERSWGWVGQRLVKSTEVEEKIKELMSSDNLSNSAKRVGEEARKAWDVNGSSSERFNTIIETSISKTKA